MILSNQLRALFVALLLISTGVESKTLYNIVDLGDLPGGADLSAALNINDSNQVVGWSYSAEGQRAVLWENGSIIDLGKLPGGNDRATAASINNSGHIAGWSSTTTGTRAVMWNNGSIVDLGDLPGGLDSSSGGFINNVDQVAGYSSGTYGTHAFIWQNGGLTDLGDLPGGNNFSISLGINNKGEVAGYSSVDGGQHAFLWQNGLMIDLGDLPGGLNQSIATSINDHTEIVGYSYNSTMINSFLWKDNVMTELPVLAGYSRSIAYDINNHGTIVGALTLETSYTDQAFIFDKVNGIANLNELIDSSDPLYGQFILSQANAINDDGYIVGYGKLGTVSNRAFLLIPVNQDTDEDGVNNNSDLCENTPSDSVVNSDGCSIKQLVPCDGPWGTDESWIDHGHYVEAVVLVTDSFIAADLVLSEDKDIYITVAAQSLCGK